MDRLREKQYVLGVGGGTRGGGGGEPHVHIFFSPILKHVRGKKKKKSLS